MTTETAPQFALIKFQTFGKNASVVKTGSEGAILALHEATAEYGTGWFYSVRPVDHELAQLALAQQAARKRTATRIVDGIRWTRSEHRWVTEDGRFEIQYDDDFETECDAPHPMRVSQSDIKRYRQHGHQHGHGNDPAFKAIRDGRKGWLCEGGEIHFYGQWVAGTVGDVDVITRTDTLKDAMQDVAHFVQTGHRNA
jgi:hypothetical protein